MTAHDGNGWKRCELGHRHWGRNGAAGLLVTAPETSGNRTVLLQLRSHWVSHGGTWAPPGGARDSHESAVGAALREAAEECSIDTSAVRVFGIRTDDHGGWSYQTVLAAASAPLPVSAVSAETRDVAWLPVADVDRLRLHPGFFVQWPALRAALVPLTVIVDVANVMGSRPDGWWKNRVGAARRLLDDLAGLASRGVGVVPGLAPGTTLDRWFPRYIAVLEGAAAAAGGDDLADPEGADAGWASHLVVARAAGSGDDEIARLAALTPGERLVVTADRELRARCEDAGAKVTGPRWLLGQL